MDIRKIEHVLLISICFLIILPLLYSIRSADANTFTSWRWVFADTAILRCLIFLVPSIMIAYCLSRLPLPGYSEYLLLFFLSLIVVAPLWSEPESIIDASRYFIQAKSVEEYGAANFLREWGNGIHAWTDMPLVPFLDGLVFSFIGEKRIYIQALNTLLFALTALLTCLIGGKLWDRETGINAGLLLLGIPYLLMQVPLMLVDVPTMFFLSLAIYLFLSVLQNGGFLRATAAALALFLALLCKYSTWPMLLLIVAVVSVQFTLINRKQTLVRTAWVLIMAGLVVSAVIASRAELFHDQIMLLKTYQWPALGHWNEGWASMFLFQIHPFITGLALYAIFRAVKEKDTRFLTAGSFFLLVALLQLKRIRYMIPLLPLLVLSASFGLNKIIKHTGIKKFITLCIVASSLIIACTAYLPFVNKISMVNLKLAGEYLDTLKQTSVEVFALPQKNSSGSTFSAIPLLDYYTGKKIISVQDWPGHSRDGHTKSSSLRFTWEMKKPAFYSGVKGSNEVVAFISEGMPQKVPARFAGREVEKFEKSSGIFKYKITVNVYRKAILSQTGQF